MSATSARLFVMILGWVSLSALNTFWQTTQDDWHYGRHINSDGHHDSTQNPSHFIAIYLNRHILIIEFPGGDPAKSIVYSGPVLLGPDLLQAIEDAERRYRLSSPESTADTAKDQVIAALRRRLDELKQTVATKDAELRQKQREIDQLYAKLAGGSAPVERSEMGPPHEEGVAV